MAPNTACLSNAAAKKTVLPAPTGIFDGNVGPNTSEGTPIVAELVLEPLTWPSCRNASGSALLARMMFVKIIWSRACSDAMS